MGYATWFASVAGVYSLFFPEERLPVIHRVWIYLRVYERLHVRVLMTRKSRAIAEILGKICSVGIGAVLSLM
jgi:hypothetical protein